MPTAEFEKRMEHLISEIRTKITGDRELGALASLINKLVLKREAKIQKAQKAKTKKARAPFLKTRVPSVVSLHSTNNVTHEEALQELIKTIEPWK
jgi:hypothetical protein